MFTWTVTFPTAGYGDLPSSQTFVVRATHAESARLLAIEQARTETASARRRHAEFDVRAMTVTEWTGSLSFLSS